MTQKKLRQLAELIFELVSETDGQSWRDRRDQLLSEASDDEALAIHEFADWWEAS
jgi:hypothetical protein